jgi:DNA-binding LacI/PurR family transcriptional regulator
MQSRRGGNGAVRIGDVAKVAGVSPQTVSNVVNNRGGFTEDTRRRVLAAVTQTGYRPNRAARQLRTNRTRQIGFSIEGSNLDARNPFTISLLREIVDAARPSGHRVMVFTCELGDVEAFEHIAKAGEVDAFVFANVTPGDFRTNVLSALGIPFVVMGRTGPREPQTWIDIDNRAAIASIVDYLAAKGHTEFAYIGYSGSQHWNVERLDGARARLAEHGLVLADDRILQGTYEQVAVGIDPILKEPQGQRPTAFITSSDTMAVLVTQRAQALDLTVGRDLAVTGFDGGLLDWIVDPPLTTVRIPVKRVAQAIIARMLRELEGPTGEPGTLVPTELIVGGSG